jgi:hypothetical protein
MGPSSANTGLQGDEMMERAQRLVSVEDYEPLVGGETVERILRKAARLRDLHVVHMSSTYR